MSKRSERAVSDDIEEEQHREFLLSALRTASLRAKTIDNELTTIGIALKNGMIGTDTAVAWVRDCGMLWFVGAIPEQVGRVAKANTTPIGGTISNQQQDSTGGDL